MLRRKIETQLEVWRSAPKRTALLVTGARQIGKTYIIRHFAQQHYDHIAEDRKSTRLNSSHAT